MKYRAFLFLSLLSLSQTQASPTVLPYKEELGAAHGAPVDKKQKVMTRKQLPIMGSLADITPAKFQTLDHSHWAPFGLKTQPAAKTFHFAFEFNTFAPSRLLPLELFQLACIKDLSDPQKPIFHEGRDDLHNFFHELETTITMNHYFGTHKGLMTCKLFLPQAFEGTDGDQLDLVFWVCGMHGPRLTDEVIAAECTGNGVAVAVVDTLVENKNTDILSHSILGSGGALLRLHQILQTFPHINSARPVAFGNDYGGLVVWMSMQKEIYSKYSYESTPLDYALLINTPPLLAFKLSPVGAHIQFTQGGADKVTLKTFQTWFQILEKERETRNYHLMEEILPEEGQGMLSLDLEGEGLKLQRGFMPILINQEVEEIYQAVHQAVQVQNFQEELRKLIEEENDPSNLFSKLVSDIPGFEVITTKQTEEDANAELQTVRHHITFGEYREMEKHLSVQEFPWKGSVNYAQIKDEIVETFSQILSTNFDPAAHKAKKSAKVLTDSH